MDPVSCLSAFKVAFVNSHCYVFVVYLICICVLTYLPTYLPAYIPTYLPTYIHTYLTTYLPTYLPTHIPTYLPTYLPATYLPTYLPLGATALGEPWPPLQPVSTALYSSSSLSILSLFIFFRSFSTSSSHQNLGLPFLNLEHSLPFNILFGIALSSILSTCPNHLILCDLMKL
jgi:hypothetical protein